MTAQIKQARKKVVMTIDLGSSKTKIVVQEFDSKVPAVLLIDSQVADVGRESLDFIEAKGLPEERTWVGFNDTYFAIGALARNRFGGIPQVRELKYEMALPKICAAVWLVREKMSLPSKFNLYLTVLLPSGEISDEHLLKSRLAKSLEAFETPSGKMSIKLAGYQASPEGWGVYSYRSKMLGDKSCSSSQTYVTLGFRNASAFSVRSGVVEPGQTSDFGMYWMLNLLSSRISGFDKNDPLMLQTIVEGASNSQLLKKLSRKRTTQDIDTDFDSIQTALHIARNEYVRAITRWLKSLDNSDEIVFCGGTSEYLRSELENYYATVGTQIIWHGGVKMPSDIELLLGHRLADVWALHKMFFDLVANISVTSLKGSKVDKSVSPMPEEKKELNTKKLSDSKSKKSVPEIQADESAKPAFENPYVITERPASFLPRLTS